MGLTPTIENAMLKRISNSTGDAGWSQARNT